MGIDFSLNGVQYDQTATVWMRFKKWTGKAVYHCHILPHEDTGMMGNLMIRSREM